MSLVSTDSDAVRVIVFSEVRMDSLPFLIFSVGDDSRTKSASVEDTGVLANEQSLTTGLLSARAFVVRLKVARALAIMKDEIRDMVFPVSMLDEIRKQGSASRP